MFIAQAFMTNDSSSWILCSASQSLVHVWLPLPHHPPRCLRCSKCSTILELSRALCPALDQGVRPPTPSLGFAHFTTGSLRSSFWWPLPINIWCALRLLFSLFILCSLSFFLSFQVSCLLVCAVEYIANGFNISCIQVHFSSVSHKSSRFPWPVGFVKIV